MITLANPAAQFAKREATTLVRTRAKLDVKVGVAQNLFICTNKSQNFLKIANFCSNFLLTFFGALQISDYLHDERYIRLQGTSSGGNDLGSLYQSLQRDVVILKILVGVCLVVISLILAAFSAFLVYFWRRIYNPSPKDKSTTTPRSDKDDAGRKDKKKGANLPVIYDNKVSNP